MPKEGTIVWFDMLAIPADAPHPENALRLHQLHDAPEVIADISNSMTTPTATLRRIRS